MHRIMLAEPVIPKPGELVEIAGEEAHHAARVKRLEPGEPLELLDGFGTIAAAELVENVKLGKKEGWLVRARVASVERVPRPVPGLTVRTPAPKGPRLETMIDQLGQAGAEAWSPLMTRRTVVDPRAGKLDRLSRVTLETAKQSGRAWAMAIEGSMAFDRAIGAGVVVADASGESYEPSGADAITLLVGPEGGWTEAELDAARAAGAQIAGFGSHVMRIETAAVVAAGIVLDAETRSKGDG